MEAGLHNKIYIYLLFLVFSTKVYAVEFKGEFKQGSFILGKTSPENKISIDDRNIRVSKDGYFAFGLDRDRKNDVIIKIKKNGDSKKIIKRTHWYEMVYSGSKNVFPQAEEGIEKVEWLSLEESIAKSNESFKSIREVWNSLQV